MSNDEYRSLKKRWHTVIAILIPTLMLVAWNAVDDHFAIKNIEENKIDRTEFYMQFYEVQLIQERKTAALEQIATGAAEDIPALREEIKRLSERIDRHNEQHFRTRDANVKKE